MCGFAGLLLVPSISGQIQDSPLTQTLDKAGPYVNAFERKLAGVVAEETYTQVAGGARRALKSDLLLVPVGTEARYVQFRDVFEVDGRPVRDREDRLTRLFLDKSESSSAQLRAIAEESARYNIGRVQRTVNIPTLALIFLRPENQQAAVFTLTTRTTPELRRLGGDLATDAQSADFAAVPTGTQVVAYKEGSRNTLIRRAGNRDMPSSGRFWVDPATGSVLMTELTADDGTITAVIDVRYRSEPSVAGAMMPSEMRESYSYNFNGPSGVIGRATYDNFRTFQVTTSTDVAKPVK